MQFLILSMYFFHICQRKVSIKFFCALTILSIIACGFILSSVRIIFESQTDYRRGFIHQPCFPNWAVLLLPMCLNSTHWWFLKRTFSEGVWELFHFLCSCFNEADLRQKQADLSCTLNSPLHSWRSSEFLSFNFNFFEVLKYLLSLIIGNQLSA